MAYARAGWDSDVYVVGTTQDGVYLIECLGCKLHSDLRLAQTDEERALIGEGEICGIPYTEMAWDFGEPQCFTTGEAAVQHLLSHREAGHKVPDHCLERLREDDWVPWE